MNGSDYTNASACHMSNFLQYVANLKEGDGVVDLMRGKGFYNDGKREERSV